MKHAGFEKINVQQKNLNLNYFLNLNNKKRKIEYLDKF